MNIRVILRKYVFVMHVNTDYSRNMFHVVTLVHVWAKPMPYPPTIKQVSMIGMVIGFQEQRWGKHVNTANIGGPSIQQPKEHKLLHARVCATPIFPGDTKVLFFSSLGCTPQHASATFVYYRLNIKLRHLIILLRFDSIGKSVNMNKPSNWFLSVSLRSFLFHRVGFRSPGLVAFWLWVSQNDQLKDCKTTWS